MRSPIFVVGLAATLIIALTGTDRAQGEAKGRVASTDSVTDSLRRPPLAPETPTVGNGQRGKPVVRGSIPSAVRAKPGIVRSAAVSALHAAPPAARSSALGQGIGSRGGASGRTGVPSLDDVLALGLPGPDAVQTGAGGTVVRTGLNAKALYCLDCKSNKVLLAHNDTVPMPIASITKLLTAMVVIDKMKLDDVVEVGDEITKVEPTNVGIRPGDLFTVKDLLHGMLMESGNDCAEALAMAYAKGGRSAFVREINRKAMEIGAEDSKVFTPSGLDVKMPLGRKGGTTYFGKRYNSATAKGVALIARHAMKYPLISEISNTKHYVMQARNKKGRKYTVLSTDRLLNRPLPVAVAKTGFTNHAGRCIVALFKNEDKEHVVVVLNSPQHFKVAEKIYRWATSAL